MQDYKKTSEILLHDLQKGQSEVIQGFHHANFDYNPVPKSGKIWHVLADCHATLWIIEFGPIHTTKNLI